MELADLTRMYDFTGRTIVVTGGAGILGGEIAQALVGCGANVAILDLNLDPAKGILDKMGPRASQVITVTTNVLDVESLRQAAQTVMEKFGTVDCLVNAAGGNKPQATTSATVTSCPLMCHKSRDSFLSRAVISAHQVNSDGAIFFSFL